jgi:hypothetical protein
MVPKDMMKQWAHELGINPIKLVKKIDDNFLANLERIQKIPKQQIQNFLRVFCGICGEENNKNDNFCVSCGTRLDS